nr:MAG TPA: hypothetical protein [Bacteriophage sp.]
MSNYQECVETTVVYIVIKSIFTEVIHPTLINKRV